jgi:hypothetical protein
MWIIINPEAQSGNSSLANRMIQLIYAKSISQKISNPKLVHSSFPEFNLPATKFFHLVNITSKMIQKLRIPIILDLEVENVSESELQKRGKLFARLSGVKLIIHELEAGREWAKEFFPNDLVHSCCRNIEEYEKIIQNYNIVHIRLGDTIRDGKPRRADYHPLPISFYSSVAKESKRPFAFIFQDQSLEWYRELLLGTFRSSIEIPPGCIHRDFWLLRNAKEATIAISTFSYLATWMGDHLEKTWIPNGGFLDIKIRADIDLIPTETTPLRIIDINPPSIHGNDEDFKKYIEG